MLKRRVTFAVNVKGIVRYREGAMAKPTVRKNKTKMMGKKRKSEESKRQLLWSWPEFENSHPIGVPLSPPFVHSDPSMHSMIRLPPSLLSIPVFQKIKQTKKLV
jgi:hypothetical protein